MWTIFFISLFAMIEALSYLDEVPKDINVLFPRANNPDNATLTKIAAFDIQKIDIDKLMGKIESINNSFLNDEVSARKRGIPLDITKVADDKYRSNYTNAADIKAKQKICDLMLQVIYMARHGVRRLESNPLFNKHDIGYRIGVLFSKLRTIYKRIRDIYQTMTNAEDDNYFAGGTSGQYNRNLHREDRYLIMHHRIVKLHTDFLYLFWVTVKIDGLFAKLNVVGHRPPLNLTNAGISIENREIG